MTDSATRQATTWCAALVPFICFTSGCALSESPSAVPTEEDSAAQTHEWVRELALDHIFVLLQNPTSPREPMEPGAQAIEAYDLLARTDDRRRPDVDLCCRVLLPRSQLQRLADIEEESGHHSALFVAGLGALFTEEQQLDPVGYFVDLAFPLETRRSSGSGEIELFDGFASSDELFAFVNDSPAALVVATSLSSVLYPQEDSAEETPPTP